MDDGQTEATSLRAAAAADLRAAAGWRRVALAGVVVWMLYEWGPGNETLTPWVVARVIDGQGGVAVIAVTTAVGFTLTFVQQVISGVTALIGFSAFPGVAAAAATRLRAHLRAAPTPWDAMGWAARGALAFGLGTTAVALIQVVATARTGVRAHVAVVGRSALLCALIVATFSGVAATLAYAGRRSARLAGPTEDVLDVLGNPLLWLALFAAMLVFRVVRRDHSSGSLDVA